MTDHSLSFTDPVAAGIAKKRRELQLARAELEKQIRAIDKSIALLGQAVQIFDPSTKLHFDAHGIKQKRFQHTRRFVLNAMRDAGRSLTVGEIGEAWMRDEQVEITTASRRVIVGRVRSCIQNMRVQGLVERDGDAWRLTV